MNEPIIFNTGCHLPSSDKPVLSGAEGIEALNRQHSSRSVFWKDTSEDLARALLSIAQAANMSDSYWFTDSRIELACSILGIQPEEARDGQWWD